MFYRTCSLSTATLRENRIRNISDSTSRFSRSSIFFALSNEVNYTHRKNVKTKFNAMNMINATVHCTTTNFTVSGVGKLQFQVSNLRSAFGQLQLRLVQLFLQFLSPEKTIFYLNPKKIYARSIVHIMKTK